MEGVARVDSLNAWAFGPGERASATALLPRDAHGPDKTDGLASRTSHAGQLVLHNPNTYKSQKGVPIGCLAMEVGAIVPPVRQQQQCHNADNTAEPTIHSGCGFLSLNGQLCSDAAKDCSPKPVKEAPADASTSFPVLTATSLPRMPSQAPTSLASYCSALSSPPDASYLRGFTAADDPNMDDTFACSLTWTPATYLTFATTNHKHVGSDAAPYHVYASAHPAPPGGTAGMEWRSQARAVPPRHSRDRRGGLYEGTVRSGSPRNTWRYSTGEAGPRVW